MPPPQSAKTSCEDYEPQRQFASSRMLKPRDFNGAEAKALVQAAFEQKDVQDVIKNKLYGLGDV